MSWAPALLCAPVSKPPLSYSCPHAPRKEPLTNGLAVFITRARHREAKESAKISSSAPPKGPRGPAPRFRTLGGLRNKTPVDISVPVQLPSKTPGRLGIQAGCILKRQGAKQRGQEAPGSAGETALGGLSAVSLSEREGVPSRPGREPESLLSKPEGVPSRPGQIRGGVRGCPSGIAAPPGAESGALRAGRRPLPAGARAGGVRASRGLPGGQRAGCPGPRTLLSAAACRAPTHPMRCLGLTAGPRLLGRSTVQP